MPVNQRNRVSAYGAVIAACTLSAIVASAHSADSSDPSRNTGLPCGYEVAAIIQGPPQPALVTRVTGLNEDGWVSGYWSGIGAGSDRAYYWKPEFGDSVFTIPLPAGYTRSFGLDINDNGLLVGHMSGPGNHSRGFVYDTNSNEMLAILEPVQNIGSAQCWANAINNDGVVVGARSLGETENPHNAFIWTPLNDDPSQGTYADLGVMNGPKSTATGISENGAVTGYTGPNLTSSSAFLYSNGSLIVIAPPEGGETAVSRDVNDKHELIGTALVPNRKGIQSGRGFLWGNGAFKVFDVLPGFYASGAWAINNASVVVGGATAIGTPNIYRGFIWIDGAMIDINDLLDEPDITIERGRAVNDAMQIAATGKFSNSLVAFLLSPISRSPGDLTGDCEVGVDDLAFLLTEWGKRSSPADINCDGIVNGADLAILLGNWTE